MRDSIGTLSAKLEAWVIQSKRCLTSRPRLRGERLFSFREGGHQVVAIMVSSAVGYLRVSERVSHGEIDLESGSGDAARDVRGNPFSYFIMPKMKII